MDKASLRAAALLRRDALDDRERRSAAICALVQGSPYRLPVDPSAVPSRKASTWVLGFEGSVLRSADYYSHPTG